MLRALPRHRMGRASPRRSHAFRVPRARERSGRLELVDDTAQARRLPTRVRGFRCGEGRAFQRPRRDAAACKTPASCATGRRSRPPSPTRARFLADPRGVRQLRRVRLAVRRRSADHKPLARADAQVPATTPESDALSKDLKQRGFKFVGSTIVYAHMQATGLVNDHLVTCFLRARKVRRGRPVRAMNVDDRERVEAVRRLVRDRAEVTRARRELRPMTGRNRAWSPVRHCRVAVTARLPTSSSMPNDQVNSE